MYPYSYSEQSLSGYFSQRCVYCRSSSSLITITRPPSSSSLKITNRSFRYASPSLWNNLPASSVNLVHHLSPPSHHPSLPLSSIPDLKLTCSTNPSQSHHPLLHTGLPTGLQPDCLHRLRSSAFCFSFFVIFFYLTRV